VILERDRSVMAFRLVIGATLGALLWKVMSFAVFARVYFEVPLTQRLFPAFFESPITFLVSYGGTIAALVLSLMMPGVSARRAFIWIALAGVSILCVHQGSYNDASFTTAWWTLLWSAWLAGRMAAPDDQLLLRAARLSRAILAMILLGGAVGKWTSEYWSGQVLYEIYFTERDFWLFNALRANVGAAALREIATWYSRAVIVVESLCGLTLWALPSRLAAVVGIVVCGTIVLLSNFQLASVLLSLVGLAGVGLLVPGSRTPRST
jgi:hypothetical protein